MFLYAPVTQLVECLIEAQKVSGSNPLGCTKLKKNSLHTFVILYSDMPIKLSCDDNKFLVNIDDPLV